MSQVTEQSVRFQTALASIKLIQASAVLDLTEDDFDFLTSNKVWIATDRSRARRCVEACVYGTLDFVGYPRFPAPVEFIAAVIAYYVHPVNIQTACLIMEGAEFTENIINGVERPVKAAELFAFTLRVRAGNTDVLTSDGWFIVFDTLTLADDRLEAFYDNPNALRDYFRDIGRMVLAAEGRKANDSHADCYQYFCVPEYGTANGRLHFHAVHFMRTLPTGSVDPNFGRRVRNRRQLNSLQNTWPYGYSMPIAVRYTQDAFSRSGWLWPVD